MLLFLFLAGQVAAAAILLLLTPHLLYALLSFLALLLGMAGLYFLQGAAFVGVAHMVVYGGAVLVLLLFSALLVPLDTHRPSSHPKLLISLCMVLLLATCLYPQVHLAAQILHRKSPLYVTQPDNVATLGLQLLGPYAFVFEWVGLVLLIVLVGVAYLMKDATPQERSNQQKEGQKVDD